MIAINLKKDYLQFFLNINLTFYDHIVQSVFPGSIKNNTNIFHGIIKMKICYCEKTYCQLLPIYSEVTARDLSSIHIHNLSVDKCCAITCAQGSLLIQLTLRGRGCFSIAQLQPRACTAARRVPPPSSCKRARHKHQNHIEL